MDDTDLDGYADMAFDDDEASERVIPDLGAPSHPYGLRICLTLREINKMGMTSLPEKDDLLHFGALARVTSISAGESEGDGEFARIELQIMHITRIEDEDTETV